MNRRKAFFSILTYASILGSVFFSQAASAQSSTLKIALAGPITGENAAYGDVLTKGARLAVENINRAGGIDGAQLELVLGDDQMDPRQAPLVAQRLAQDESVLAVIGHFASTNTLAAMPIYNRVGVPVLSHSSSQSLTGISKWFFRLTNPNDILGKALGEYALQIYGPGKAVIMYGQSDGNKMLNPPFEEAFKGAGGEIAEMLTHQLSDKDFSAEITKLKSIQPDFIYLNSFFEAASLILKQAADSGYQGKYLGADSLNSADLIALAGDASRGLLVPSSWDPDSEVPAIKEFVTSYRTAYGVEPDAYGAQAYAGVEILAAAFKAGARTRADVQVYLDKAGQETGFETAAGHIKWDASHDPNVTLVILESDGTKFVKAAKQP